MGDWDGIPMRFCVDQYLPDHLHETAGKLASSERPADAILMDPTFDIPEGVFRSAEFTPEDQSRLLFQRMGLLRKAKWEPGRTIAIGFTSDAPPGIPSRIMAILEESSQVLNLHWRQVSVSQAEYRVAFQRGAGLWSMIGSQSLMVRDRPTCNLGDINWGDPRDLVRCVRHEIVGHGTGCLHAQSLESYSQIIDLDLPAILAYYQQSQGWTYEQAKAQFDKVSRAEVEEGLQTRTSIMAYEIPPQFDRKGRGIPFNWDWDEADREQFRRSYPGSGPADPPDGDGPPPGPGQPLRLPWRKVMEVAFPAGGVVILRVRAPAATNLTVRIQELAAGTPTVDVVGSATVRLKPTSGSRRDVVRFIGRLGGPGDYDLLVRFQGPAPDSFKIVAERA